MSGRLRTRIGRVLIAGDDAVGDVEPARGFSQNAAAQRGVIASSRNMLPVIVLLLMDSRALLAADLDARAAGIGMSSNSQMPLLFATVLSDRLSVTVTTAMPAPPKSLLLSWMVERVTTALLSMMDKAPPPNPNRRSLPLSTQPSTVSVTFLPVANPAASKVGIVARQSAVDQRQAGCRRRQKSAALGSPSSRYARCGCRGWSRSTRPGCPRRAGWRRRSPRRRRGHAPA